MIVEYTAEVEPLMLAMRPVFEGHATLGELDSLSIDDVDLYGLALDARQHAQRQEQANRDRERGRR